MVQKNSKKEEKSVSPFSSKLMSLIDDMVLVGQHSLKLEENNDQIQISNSKSL